MLSESRLVTPAWGSKNKKISGFSQLFRVYAHLRREWLHWKTHNLQQPLKQNASCSWAKRFLFQRYRSKIFSDTQWCVVCSIVRPLCCLFVRYVKDLLTKFRIRRFLFAKLKGNYCKQSEPNIASCYRVIMRLGKIYFIVYLLHYSYSKSPSSGIFPALPPNEGGVWIRLTGLVSSTETLPE